MDLSKVLVPGAAVWIHDLGACYAGNIAIISAALKDAGVSTIFLKSDDGGRWYPQYTSAGSAAWWWIAFQFQQAGFKVWAWGYHLGGEPKQQYTANGKVYDTTEGFEAEAAIAVQAITYRPPEEPRYRGPDGYIFDVEDEYAGRATQAAWVANSVRAACGPDFPLAYAPIGVPQYHVADPYFQFNAVCDLCFPQCYDTMFKNPGGPDWSLTEFVAAAKAYGLDKPWFPIYCDVPGGYEPSAGDFATWIATALDSQSGPKFVSVWVLDELSGAGVGRVAQVNAQLAPVPKPVPAPARVPTNDDLEHMHQLLDKIDTSGGEVPDIPGLVSYAEQFISSSI